VTVVDAVASAATVFVDVVVVLRRQQGPELFVYVDEVVIVLVEVAVNIVVMVEVVVLGGACAVFTTVVVAMPGVRPSARSQAPCTISTFCDVLSMAWLTVSAHDSHCTGRPRLRRLDLSAKLDLVSGRWSHSPATCSLTWSNDRGAADRRQCCVSARDERINHSIIR
jgi:hypothetical protein